MNDVIKHINSYNFKKPKICITLGSGLGSFVELIDNKRIIKYYDIPGFFSTSIKGHKGEFIMGEINDIPILCANGRFHYYEGYNFEEVSSIVKIFNSFKPKIHIITNSSGCLNLNWNTGDFMIANRFLDFSFIKSAHVKFYEDKNSINIIPEILKIAKNNSINLNVGTYTYTQGPSYETPAEIQEIIKEGGDAVGMSTFPEFLTCKKLNMKSIVISCLTNYGAGLIKNSTIEHEDVIKNARKGNKNFI